METVMPEKNTQCDIGMVGLGVMGRNLLLNMADHGFHVAGFDTDAKKVESLYSESNLTHVSGATHVNDFINLLKKPRAIILLVPAGEAVDAVIHDLLPGLEAGDLIIDAGNSHFTNTDVRARNLEKKGIQFLGVGISGGEEGARRGPSIMPGGPKTAYEKVRPIFEAVAAKVNGDPCVTYLGNGSVGHYVKMVHNGIEYGIMQLIAETYDLMKRGLGLPNDQLSEIYAEWNDSELNSYLIEITSKIFDKKDADTQKQLIDEILGVAKQNGTGMWTSFSAMELQIPVPSIDLAVMMRDMSVLVKQREQAGSLYSIPVKKITVSQQVFIKQIKSALFAAIITVYAQGMALLRVASGKYNYDLDLEAVARIWRGGCIIRASLLENIRTAYGRSQDLPNLLLDADMAKLVISHQENLRQVVAEASLSGIPIPTLMVSLGYLDSYRSLWAPANLIQAQRDYFGSHMYERLDKQGVFHTEW
jgi:6-phosphogluconate dehydrogenase